jgi:hypothetical protein
VQRFELVEEGYQRKVKEAQDEALREIQKTGIKAAHLEAQLKKVQEAKQESDKTIAMHESDARETVSSMALMRIKCDKHCQQYEANLKTMRRRVGELEGQNLQLSGRLDKYAH